MTDPTAECKHVGPMKAPAMKHQFRSFESFRLQRGAERVHGLGPRAVFELLAELAMAHDCWPDTLRRLDRYRAITPDMLLAARGDRFPPRQLDLVSR